MAGRVAGHFLSRVARRSGLAECSAQIADADEGDPFAGHPQPEFPGCRIGLHSCSDRAERYLTERQIVRQVTVLPVLAALMLQTAQADVVRHSLIPKDLRGQWLAAEARPQAARSVINLSATAYQGPRANCTVDWVSQTAGRRGSIYAAHIQCLDPLARANVKTLTNLIIWPVDGDQIKVGPDFESLQMFRRCSATCEPRENRSAESAQQLPTITTE
jgi:hypothetical protein